MKMTLIRLMKAYDICQKADEHILQKKEYEREIEEATKKVAKKIETRILLDVFIVLFATVLLTFGNKGAIIYIMSMSAFNILIAIDILILRLIYREKIKQSQAKIALEEQESVRIICEYENELSFLPNEFRNIDAIEFMLSVLKSDDTYSLEFIFRMCKRYLYKKKRQVIYGLEQT
ncbi:MAG: hypothetical protein II013_03690 [Lachnobacterium sp.]|nr:hypothetical protein [Lachnobacterium sp.]